jgi:hypothetical protein
MSADEQKPLTADRSRVTSDEYREKAAQHRDRFTASHRRVAHVLRAVDELYGPAAAEVLRRLFDDIGENAGEAIDNLSRYAGLLRAELEDRRINEVREVRRAAAELAIENTRLRQVGRVLALELETAARLTGHRRRQRRAAVSAWHTEDPQ